MLGKMEEGADYAEVLKEAQDLGYAEVRLSSSPASNVRFTWYTWGSFFTHLHYIHYHDIYTYRQTRLPMSRAMM